MFFQEISCGSSVLEVCGESAPRVVGAAGTKAAVLSVNIMLRLSTCSFLLTGLAEASFALKLHTPP